MAHPRDPAFWTDGVVPQEATEEERHRTVVLVGRRETPIEEDRKIVHSILRSINLDAGDVEIFRGSKEQARILNALTRTNVLKVRCRTEKDALRVRQVLVQHFRELQCSYVRMDLSLEELKQDAEFRVKCRTMNQAAGTIQFSIRDAGIVDVLTGKVVERFVTPSGVSTTKPAEERTSAKPAPVFSVQNRAFGQGFSGLSVASTKNQAEERRLPATKIIENLSTPATAASSSFEESVIRRKLTPKSTEPKKNVFKEWVDPDESKAKMARRIAEKEAANKKLLKECSPEMAERLRFVNQTIMLDNAQKMESPFVKSNFVKHIPWDPIQPHSLPEFSSFRKEKDTSNQNASSESSAIVKEGQPSVESRPRTLEDFEFEPPESERFSQQRRNIRITDATPKNKQDSSRKHVNLKKGESRPQAPEPFFTPGLPSLAEALQAQRIADAIPKTDQQGSSSFNRIEPMTAKLNEEDEWSFTDEEDNARAGPSTSAVRP